MAETFDSQWYSLCEAVKTLLAALTDGDGAKVFNTALIRKIVDMFDIPLVTDFDAVFISPGDNAHAGGTNVNSAERREKECVLWFVVKSEDNEANTKRNLWIASTVELACRGKKDWLAGKSIRCVVGSYGALQVQAGPDKLVWIWRIPLTFHVEEAWR